MIHQDSVYRVVSRRAMLAVLVTGFCGGILALWLSMESLNVYSAWVTELVYSDPERAIIELTADLKLMAAFHGVPIWIAAALLFSYGYRGIQTRSMPPVGSWVVEGQRIRTGSEAVLVAKLMVGAAAVLALLVAGTSLLIWTLADELRYTSAGF